MNRHSFRIVAAVALTAMLAVPQSLFAAQAAASPQQTSQNIASQAVRTRALASHVAAQQQTREAVASLLSQPDVQKVAKRLGMSVTNVESAVANLTSQELDRLAEPVAHANAELAGGSTLVISTTTLLLIIIIVILVAD